VAAGEYLRERRTELFADAKSRDHFHNHMFHGYDFDNTMLRIGSMNMALHGVDGPDIRYKDSLAEEHAGDQGEGVWRTDAAGCRKDHPREYRQRENIAPEAGRLRTES
jgi:type I restriction-modification system DNA methylase subunit